jgi:hypothetical protein
MATRTQGTETRPDAAPIEKKPFFDRILGSTPVVMTVIATILAGMSSSEMTQAQYHRSLAAQSQSKAGDQWSFFQAKRIRGMSLQTTIDLLQAVSGSARVDPAFLQTAVQQLIAGLEEMKKETDHLLRGAKASKNGSAAQKLSEAATRLNRLLDTKLTEARKLSAELDKELSRTEIQQALGFLTSDRLPVPETKIPQQGQIAEAMKAVSERRPETQISAILSEVKPVEIDQGIQTAEVNALAVERANKPVNAALDKLATIMQNLAAIAREVQRATREMVQSGRGSSPEIESKIASLPRTALEARQNLDEANNDLKVAEYNYMVRRYRSEADANQNAAVAHETQVRKSSLTSEKHRERSKDLFYGMLIAQAGVTIATLSLALRFRSTLWTFATLAGVIALAIGVRVYLFM